jgi:hypothetical protein
MKVMIFRKIGMNTIFNNQGYSKGIKTSGMKSQLLLVIILFLASCQKEETKVPDTGRKIVINGILTTDSLINLNLSRSLYITDPGLVEENLLNNAQAQVFENNVLVDSLHYDGDININLGLDIYVPSNYRSKAGFPLSGHEYEIRVNSSGMPEASARVRIPDMVKIDHLDTSLVKLSGTFQEWESNIRLYCDITFTDPGDVKNYYLLYIYRKPAFSSNSSNMVFSCQDPIVEEYLNHGTMMEGVAFSDKSINGQKHLLRVTLNGKDIGKPFFNDDFMESHMKIVYFRLYNITESYFQYIQTLNLFLRNYKNPLAEPTQVFSNIDGGYGILGGAAVSIDSVIFRY